MSGGFRPHLYETRKILQVWPENIVTHYLRPMRTESLIRFDFEDESLG